MSNVIAGLLIAAAIVAAKFMELPIHQAKVDNCIETERRVEPDFALSRPSDVEPLARQRCLQIINGYKS
jgi:hypothetical protein